MEYEVTISISEKLSNDKRIPAAIEMYDLKIGTPFTVEWTIRKPKVNDIFHGFLLHANLESWYFKITEVKESNVAMKLFAIGDNKL